MLDSILALLKKGEGRITTKGLPNLKNETRYLFDVISTSGNFYVYLSEGEWVGRDQEGWPKYQEQVDLLNSYKTEGNPSQGGWRFLSKNEIEKFLLDLAPFIMYIN